MKLFSSYEIVGVIPDWSDAACRGLDPKLFFPVRGGSVKNAKECCRLCPIKGACLDFALDNREVLGVWGGTSGKDRRRILRHRFLADSWS